MSGLTFTLREGWRSFRRGGLAGGLALVALAILAGFIALFGGAKQSLDDSRQRLLTRFELEAFVVPGRERSLNEIAERLAARPGVMAADTISKHQAAQRFAERFGEDLLPLLEENPLPASVILRYEPESVTSAQLMAEAEAVAADENIEEVAWDGELLARFEQTSRTLVWIAGGAGLLVLVVAVLLTFQSVRVAVRTGRQWARAVYLVGGTLGQIRRPLALGGLITGLSGGLLGAGIVGLAQGLLASSPWIRPPSPWILGVAVLVPILVGVLGAVRAWPRDPRNPVG